MTTTRTRTTHYVVGDDGREWPVRFAASDALAPIVREAPDGTVTVGYLADDEDLCEYEWPEGAEFWTADEHTDAVRAEAQREGLVDPPCDKFAPPFEWTDRTFWVERYEHGLVRYALSGESSSIDRGWDVAEGIAVLKLDDGWGGDPAEVARGLLETYTSWCNGDVYGVCVETFTPDGSPVTDDACWGYLGVDHAEAELRAALR